MRTFLVVIVLASLACSEEEPYEPPSGGQGDFGGGQGDSVGGDAGSAGDPWTGGDPGSAGDPWAGDPAAGDPSAGDPAPTWPTCDARPPALPATDIPGLWSTHGSSSTLTEVWVDDVIVTAISVGGCTSDTECQLFVQQSATYASFAAGAHGAIRVLVSADAAEYFTGVAVGDVVDVRAWVWRNTDGELLLEVRSTHPGCIFDVGDATPVPITGVTLDDLTATAYEQDVGPLLVELQSITGIPSAPTLAFPIWATGDPPGTSYQVSPAFVFGGAFIGLTGATQTGFLAIKGVFGLEGTTPTVYPRSMVDIQVL